MDFQKLIPLEPKVELTSNQAVNSSLSVVSRSKKKFTKWDHERALLVQGSPQIYHFLWPDPNKTSPPSARVAAIRFMQQNSKRNFI